MLPQEEAAVLHSVVDNARGIAEKATKLAAKGRTACPRMSRVAEKARQIERLADAMTQAIEQEAVWRKATEERAKMQEMTKQAAAAEETAAKKKPPAMSAVELLRLEFAEAKKNAENRVKKADIAGEVAEQITEKLVEIVPTLPSKFKEIIQPMAEKAKAIADRTVFMTTNEGQTVACTSAEIARQAFEITYKSIEIVEKLGITTQKGYTIAMQGHNVTKECIELVEAASQMEKADSTGVMTAVRAKDATQTCRKIETITDEIVENAYQVAETDGTLVDRATKIVEQAYKVQEQASDTATAASVLGLRKDEEGLLKKSIEVLKIAAEMAEKGNELAQRGRVVAEASTKYAKLINKIVNKCYVLSVRAADVVTQGDDLVQNPDQVSREVLDALEEVIYESDEMASISALLTRDVKPDRGPHDVILGLQEIRQKTLEIARKATDIQTIQQNALKTAGTQPPGRAVGTPAPAAAIAPEFRMGGWAETETPAAQEVKAQEAKAESKALPDEEVKKKPGEIKRQQVSDGFDALLEMCVDIASKAHVIEAKAHKAASLGGDTEEAATEMEEEAEAMVERVHELAHGIINVMNDSNGRVTKLNQMAQEVRRLGDSVKKMDGKLRLMTEKSKSATEKTANILNMITPLMERGDTRAAKAKQMIESSKQKAEKYQQVAQITQEIVEIAPNMQQRAGEMTVKVSEVVDALVEMTEELVAAKLHDVEQTCKGMEGIVEQVSNRARRVVIRGGPSAEKAQSVLDETSRIGKGLAETEQRVRKMDMIDADKLVIAEDIKQKTRKIQNQLVRIEVKASEIRGGQGRGFRAEAADEMEEVARAMAQGAIEIAKGMCNIEDNCGLADEREMAEIISEIIERSDKMAERGGKIAELARQLAVASGGSGKQAVGIKQDSQELSQIAQQMADRVGRIMKTPWESAGGACTASNVSYLIVIKTRKIMQRCRELTETGDPELAKTAKKILEIIEEIDSETVGIEETTVEIVEIEMAKKADRNAYKGRMVAETVIEIGDEARLLTEKGGKSAQQAGKLAEESADIAKTMWNMADKFSQLAETGKARVGAREATVDDSPGAKKSFSKIEDRARAKRTARRGDWKSGGSKRGDSKTEGDTRGKSMEDSKGASTAKVGNTKPGDGAKGKAGDVKTADGDKPSGGDTKAGDDGKANVGGTKTRESGKVKGGDSKPEDAGKTKERKGTTEAGAISTGEDTTTGDNAGAKGADTKTEDGGKKEKGGEGKKEKKGKKGKKDGKVEGGAESVKAEDDAGTAASKDAPSAPPSTFETGTEDKAAAGEEAGGGPQRKSSKKDKQSKKDEKKGGAKEGDDATPKGEDMTEGDRRTEDGAEPEAKSSKKKKKDKKKGDDATPTGEETEKGGEQTEDSSEAEGKSSKKKKKDKKKSDDATPTGEEAEVGGEQTDDTSEAEGKSSKKKKKDKKKSDDATPTGEEAGVGGEQTEDSSEAEGKSSKKKKKDKKKGDDATPTGEETEVGGEQTEDSSGAEGKSSKKKKKDKKKGDAAKPTDEKSEVGGNQTNNSSEVEEKSTKKKKKDKKKGDDATQTGEEAEVGCDQTNNSSEPDEKSSKKKKKDKKKGDDATPTGGEAEGGEQTEDSSEAEGKSSKKKKKDKKKGDDATPPGEEEASGEQTDDSSEAEGKSSKKKKKDKKKGDDASPTGEETEVGGEQMENSSEAEEKSSKKKKKDKKKGDDATPTGEKAEVGGEQTDDSSEAEGKSSKKKKKDKKKGDDATPTGEETEGGGEQTDDSSEAEGKSSKKKKKDKKKGDDATPTGEEAEVVGEQTEDTSEAEGKSSKKKKKDKKKGDDAIPTGEEVEGGGEQTEDTSEAEGKSSKKKKKDKKKGDDAIPAGEEVEGGGDQTEDTSEAEGKSSKKKKKDKKKGDDATPTGEETEVGGEQTEDSSEAEEKSSKKKKKDKKKADDATPTGEEAQVGGEQTEDSSEAEGKSLKKKKKDKIKGDDATPTGEVTDFGGEQKEESSEPEGKSSKKEKGGKGKKAKKKGEGTVPASEDTEIGSEQTEESLESKRKSSKKEKDGKEKKKKGKGDDSEDVGDITEAKVADAKTENGRVEQGEAKAKGSDGKSALEGKAEGVLFSCSERNRPDQRVDTARQILSDWMKVARQCREMADIACDIAKKEGSGDSALVAARMEEAAREANKRVKEIIKGASQVEENCTNLEEKQVGEKVRDLVQKGDKVLQDSYEIATLAQEMCMKKYTRVQQGTVGGVAGQAVPGVPGVAGVKQMPGSTAGVTAVRTPEEELVQECQELIAAAQVMSDELGQARSSPGNCANKAVKAAGDSRVVADKAQKLKKKCTEMTSSEDHAIARAAAIILQKLDMVAAQASEIGGEAVDVVERETAEKASKVAHAGHVIEEQRIVIEEQTRRLAEVRGRSLMEELYVAEDATKVAGLVQEMTAKLTKALASGVPRVAPGGDTDQTAQRAATRMELGRQILEEGIAAAQTCREMAQQAREMADMETGGEEAIALEKDMEENALQMEKEAMVMAKKAFMAAVLVDERTIQEETVAIERGGEKRSSLPDELSLRRNQRLSMVPTFNPANCTAEIALTFTPTGAEDKDKQCPLIDSLAATAKGLLVMADFRNKMLKVADVSDTSAKKIVRCVELEKSPMRLVLLSDEQVAVTAGGRRIYYITFMGEVIYTYIKTSKQYFGIDLLRTSLVVSSVKEEKDEACVDIITRNGNIISTIADPQRLPDLVWPFHVRVQKEKVVWVTDLQANALFLLNSRSGRLLNPPQALKDVKGPRQVIPDWRGHYFVVSGAGQFVTVVQRDGETRQLIEGAKHSGDKKRTRVRAVCMLKWGLAVAWDCPTEEPTGSGTVVTVYKLKNPPEETQTVPAQ